MGAEAPDNVNLTWLRSKIHVMKTASSDQAAAVEFSDMNPEHGIRHRRHPW